jgi:hypothetical protein
MRKLFITCFTNAFNSGFYFRREITRIRTKKRIIGIYNKFFKTKFAIIYFFRIFVSGFISAGNSAKNSLTAISIKNSKTEKTSFFHIIKSRSCMNV